ncbi:MAG: GAF domain-containing sensor histidine kinase [Actinomycetota bacterium]|nr:GAF domain-containing sensor histidine kinase [Actinomycetota bacterium]
MSGSDVMPPAPPERADPAGAAQAADLDFYRVALQEAVDALVDGRDAAAGVVVRSLSAGDSSAAVWDFDHASREVICRFSSLDDQIERRLPLGFGVAGWVASHRRAVIVADRHTDPRGDHYVGDARVPAAGAAVPIPGGEQYTGGVLEVYGRRQRSMSDLDLVALGRLAAVIAAGKRDSDEPAQAAVPHGSITEVEKQNRRMAAELHDGVSQRLASLSFHLSAASSALTEVASEQASTNDPVLFALAQLKVATELNQLAADDVRAAISGLRPPVLDDLGLATGLVSLCGALGAEGLTVEVDVEAVEPPFVSPPASLALYRVAQEALGNAVKHAGVASVRVRLERRGGNIVLDIRDDGVGYQQAADGTAGPQSSGLESGLGLRSMAERMQAIGGRIELWSAPGRGTHVRAIVGD